jgi:hypothetical protein
VSNDIGHILLLDCGIDPLVPRVTIYLKGQTTIESFIFSPESCHINTSGSNYFGMEEQTKRKLE